MTQLGSKKSRKGCKRCKQRRVKCDEQAPCSNCQRRNEDCSLLYDHPSSSSVATESIASSSTDEWLEDLELMHHYGTNIIYVGSRDEVLALWRDYIPQQALKHPFLMHGLLALSALHLAHINPHASGRYFELCDKHQSSALETYRTILSSTEIEPEFADALFALSAVLCISSMARSSAVCDDQGMDMYAITQVFAMARGTKDVIDVTDPHIRIGPMVAMFENTQRPPNTPITLPQPIAGHFAEIRHLLTTSHLDPDALTHCAHALNELEDIYCDILYFSTYINPPQDLQTDHLFRWKVRVSSEFLRLLEAHSPPALIILAYYAAAVTAVRSAWFTQRWAACVLRGVSLVLDEGMAHWIHWPLRQLTEQLGELGVRGPLGEVGRGAVESMHLGFDS